MIFVLSGWILKEDVIAHCNELKDKYGYGKLSFLVGILHPIPMLMRLIWW